MAKEVKPTLQLLRWSAHVPASDVQDPLGLGLRGSTRLASRLLFCITSITPRARYFSFIPWCVHDWQERERGKGFAFGLREAIALREKALILGCVAHHDGKPCDGGALVGSDNVVKWFTKGEEQIDLRKLPFAKNPALGAYFNSLVNLGFFVTQDDATTSDEDEAESTATFDDLELSELGKSLADGYGSLISRLESVRHVAEVQRRCTVRSLKELGKRGGLCELADPASADRNLLRDVFFARIPLKGDSHPVRNRSLSLMLDLCGQLSRAEAVLDEAAFSSAVYFGEIAYAADDVLAVQWPEPLADIALRWRMFYFHHYMSVALEGMFAWLVTQVSEKGIAGATVEELSQTLDSGAVSKALKEAVSLDLGGKFGDRTPIEVLRTIVPDIGELDIESSRRLDMALRVGHAISEKQLEGLIRSRKFLRSPTGLAMPMLLFSVTLARYAHWEGTKYGNWLAGAASDPYLDLVPPLVSLGLSRRFGQWWNCSWKELSQFVLTRFVVQQHQSMSYEKTAKGDRCLLQVDNGQITTRPNEVYEKIGMGNPRFWSAVRILKDLGLLSDSDEGVTSVSQDGQRLLNEELRKERPA